MERDKHRCLTCIHHLCDDKCNNCECNWEGDCYCIRCGFDDIGQCIYYKKTLPYTDLEELLAELERLRKENEELKEKSKK